MAKLGKADKERIIKRDLPGYRVVEQSSAKPKDAADTSAPPAKPDAGTPDVEALRRKYFGTADSGADSAPESYPADSNPGEASNDDDDEIVRVAPENAADPLDRGGRVKSVIISRGEVKGSQG